MRRTDAPTNVLCEGNGRTKHLSSGLEALVVVFLTLRSGISNSVSNESHTRTREHRHSLEFLLEGLRRRQDRGAGDFEGVQGGRPSSQSTIGTGKSAVGVSRSKMGFGAFGD